MRNPRWKSGFGLAGSGVGSIAIMALALERGAASCNLLGATALIATAIDLWRLTVLRSLRLQVGGSR